MESELIWKYFIVILFILYLILGFCYMYFVYRSSVKKKGFHPKKFTSMRKEVHARFLLVGIGVPIIVIITGLLIRIIYGEFNLENGNQAVYFFSIFLILTIPFSVYDQIQNQKKHKRFAFESKGEIIVDFNHSLQKKIINPIFELVVSIIYLGFFLYLDNTYHIAFSHIIILWLLFFVIRSTKFQVKPLMKERLVHQIFTPILELFTGISYVVLLLSLNISIQLSINQVAFLILLYFTLRTTKFNSLSSLRSKYSYTFTLLTINHIVMIYYLVRKMLNQSSLSILELSISSILLLALILKSAYYMVHFGHVQGELVKEAT